MTKKLWVANVPFQASEHDLRLHFSACGSVVDVEILTDPRTGRSRGHACVTMASDEDASAALDQLDGESFEGRVLRVSDSPLTKGDEPSRRVRIKQQFRERMKMVYDFDCNGAPLTLRVSAGDGESWRIEARSTEAADAVVVEAVGATRRAALEDVVKRWNESAATAGVRELDGEALISALREVKAV
jgi:hypothetical protein